jgi:hypothetical protein
MEGDKRFASLSQAAESKIREQRGIEGISGVDFCDRSMTLDREEFRNTFA